MDIDYKNNYIIKKVLPWCNDIKEAEHWYYQSIIPSFGCTPYEIVRKGRCDIVFLYIERIKDGGYS